MTTEQKINEFIANQEKALADFKSNLLKEFNPKQVFEVGSYIINHLEDVAKVTGYRLKDGDVISVRVNFKEDDELIPCYSRLTSCRPATEAEVKEALIKEAEKRGFKEGVTFNNSSLGFIDKAQKAEGDGFVWTGKYLDFGTNRVAIYSNGKWAEIVKDSPITIGGQYEVKFILVKDFKNSDKQPSYDYPTIDGHEFTKEFWEAAKKISEHSKANLIIHLEEDHIVPKDTINQILEKLK